MLAALISSCSQLFLIDAFNSSMLFPDLSSVTSNRAISASSSSCNNPDIVTMGDSRFVVKKPVPNFPVLVVSLARSLVDTCSIR